MNSLQTGSIFEVPLEKDLGFAYVKIIIAASNFIVKPFNFHSTEPGKIGIESFNDISDLCYPMLMWSDPRRRGVGKWRMVGVAELSERDHSVPDFKANRTSGFWQTNQWDKLPWDIVRNCDTHQLIFNVEYRSIRHLGIWQHGGSDAIRTKLSFFWIKKMGKNYRDYYNEEETKDFWLKAIINEVDNLMFYEEIAGIEEMLRKDFL
jgi:hypothetical protein